MLPLRQNGYERSAKSAQPGQFAIDLAKTFLRHLGDTPAGRLAVIPHIEHVFDLVQREPDSLRPLNELDAVKFFSRVKPIIRRRAPWLRQKTLPFIIMKRLNSYPGSFGNCANE